MNSETICQKCGAIGYAEVLVFCSICKKNAEHEYCLFNYPNDDTLWSCEDCLPIFPEDGLSMIFCEASQNVFANDDVKSTPSTNSSDIEILDDKIIPIDISSSSDVSIDASRATSVKADAFSLSDTSDSLFHNHSKSAKAKRRMMETASDSEPFDKAEIKRCCIGDRCSNEVPDLTCAQRKHIESVLNMSLNEKKLMHVEGDMHFQCKNTVDDAGKTNDLLDNEFPDREDQTKVVASDDGSFKHVNNICDDGLTLQQKMLSHQPLTNVPYISALPIINSCWSGHFIINDETTNFSISAHLSNKASQRVYNEAHKLPLNMCFKKKPKVPTWPKSFSRSPPTDDNIGLFFFPSSASDCRLYEQTLNEVIAKDLVLFVILEESELLVFPSTELPESFRRFQSKLYFWGVFRRKQSPISHTPSNLYVKETISKVQLSIGKNSKQTDCGVGHSNDPQPLSISSAKVPLVCKSTNPERFWETIFSSQKRYGDDVFTAILSGHVDSVRFAVDALSFVFPTNRCQYTKSRNFEWVCLGILKSLVVVVPKDVLLTSNTRKQARKMANEWKTLHHKQIFESNANAPPYAHTFLLVIVTFGIVIPEERSIYKKLIMCLVKKKGVLELVGSLGLGREVQINIIEKFIYYQEIASALACIHHFRLMDKFPPIPLLKAYHEKSWNKFHDLIAVVKYIYLFRLEEQFKVSDIDCQISRLKRAESTGTAVKKAEVQDAVTKGTERLFSIGTEQGKKLSSVPSSSQIGNSLKPFRSLKKKNSKDFKRKHKDVFSPSCMQVQPKPLPSPLPSSTMPLPPPPPLPSSTMPLPPPPPLPSAVAETPQPPPHKTSSLAKPSILINPPCSPVLSSLKKSAQSPRSGTSLQVKESQSPFPLGPSAFSKASPSSLIKSLQSLDSTSCNPPPQKHSPPRRPTFSKLPSSLTLGSSTLRKQSQPPLLSSLEKQTKSTLPGPSTLANQLQPPLPSSLEKNKQSPVPEQPCTSTKQPQHPLPSLFKRRQSPPIAQQPSTLAKQLQSSLPFSFETPKQSTALELPSTLAKQLQSSMPLSLEKPKQSTALELPSTLAKQLQSSMPLSLEKPKQSTALELPSTLAKQLQSSMPLSLEKPKQSTALELPSTLTKQPQPPLPSSLGKRKQSPPLTQQSSTLARLQPSLPSSLENPKQSPSFEQPSPLTKQPQPPFPSSLGKRKQSPSLVQHSTLAKQSSLGKRKQSPLVHPSFVRSAHHSLSLVNHRTCLGEASLPLPHSNRQITMAKPLQCRSLHRETLCSTPQPSYQPPSSLSLKPLPPPHLYPSSYSERFPSTLSHQFLFQVPLLQQPPPPQRNLWL